MTTTRQLGKYRLVAELGHGGMADVYLALVEGPAGAGFAKLAVVKRLRATLADDPEFVAMLIDEARITARLNHPNVVQMLEVGVENEEYFLAMEYLDGQPLHRIERRAARSSRTITRDAQIAVLADVLAGLHHAHELVDYDGTPLNIVHRDVTPHNIFLTYDGQVKVMDFGIAKAAGRAQETQHGIVKGKVRYMAPEQAMGLAVDRRADVFAVGLLLWQAATSVRFWGEQDELAIVQKLIAGEYQASPRAVVDDVPEELDRICRRALARKPEDRYASALEMKLDLEAFLGAAALEARRGLVALANELFAKERRDLRGIIEKTGRESSAVTPSIALLAQRAAASSTSSQIIHLGDSASISPVTTENRIVTVSSVPPASAPAPAPAPSVPPSASSRYLRRVGGAAIVAAAAGLAFAFMDASLLSGKSYVAAAAPAVVVPQIVTMESTPIRTRAAAPSPVVVADVIPSKTTPAPAPTTAPAAAAPQAPPVAIVAAPPRAPIPTATGIASSRAATQHGRLSLDATDPWSAKH